MKKIQYAVLLITLLIIPLIFAQENVQNGRSVESLREQAQVERESYRGEHQQAVQEIQQIKQTPCNQDCSQKESRLLQAQKRVLLNHVDQLIAVVERTIVLLENSDKVSDAVKQRFLPDLKNVPNEYRGELKLTISNINNAEDLRGMAEELQEATTNIKLFIRLIRQGILDDYVAKQDAQPKQTRKEVRDGV